MQGSHFRYFRNQLTRHQPSTYSNIIAKVVHTQRTTSLLCYTCMHNAIDDTELQINSKSYCGNSVYRCVYFSNCFSWMVRMEK